MRFILSILIWLLPAITQAATPLPGEQAFQLSAEMGKANTVLTHWKIAPGYHLYREHFTFTTQPADLKILGKIVFPKAIPQHDEILGNYKIYQNQVTIPVPFLQEHAETTSLIVGYQGCADSGFCYPPVKKTLSINWADRSVTVQAYQKASAQTNQQDAITQLLLNKNFLLILASFFGFGLLLTFTPCVLPMVPILAGIIFGQGKNLTTRRSFMLSFTYVISMACTYAIAGVLVALLGSNLQTEFQKPWVIGSFSALFVLLALSLLGCYDLRLPAGLQHRLVRLSHRQKGGTYLGVAVMGCLATLIVSPCVSAPLVGVLGYIGKTGDAWLGGTALFTLGLGIGSPLLLMGLSGGKLLPKVGPWMNTIKILFGILFLAMAIYLLDRIVPAPIILLLWGALLLLCAVYIGNFRSKIRSGKTVLRNTVSLAAGFSGMILMVGAATGNTNPLQPLAGLINRACIPQTGAIVPQQLDFKRIRTFAELQEALSLAKRAGKPTLVDFYADWCVACKQMARTTFSDPRVISALSNVQLLKVDVTDNDAADKTLEQRLNVIAPPTILFFDQHGQEQQTSRVVGEQSPTEFLNSLRLNN